nr:hypothetical protein [Neobacillus niacini]
MRTFAHPPVSTPFLSGLYQAPACMATTPGIMRVVTSAGIIIVPR